MLFVLSTGGSGVCSPLLRFTLSHYYAPPGLVNLRNLYLYRCRRKPHSLVCVRCSAAVSLQNDKAKRKLV